MSGAETAAIRVGDVLAGKYCVERVLGMGGMGVVVAARHADLGELRAIKLMLPEVLHNAEAVERFLREARATVGLKSRHVVKVHDVGRLDSGAPYIVMEHLQGSDAAALLEREGHVPAAVAAEIVLQALEALAEAHTSGIVHRDLKPANLFLTQDEDGQRCVKILDFGISKLTRDGGAMAMTRSSTLMGSPYYMSPEQMKSTRDVDHRTDIWALGVILYEMTTGTLPFKGETLPAQGALVLGTQPELPSMRRPELRGAVDALVLKCLAKDPNDRFPDALALARALAPLAGRVAERSVERIERVLGVPRGSRASLPEPQPEQPEAHERTAALASSATRAGMANTVASLPVTSPARAFALAGVIGLVVLAGGAFAIGLLSAGGDSRDVPTLARAAPALALGAAKLSAASLLAQPAAETTAVGSELPPAASATPSASVVTTSSPVAPKIPPIVRPEPSKPQPVAAPATAAPAKSANPFGWGN